jgi:hypothetical protein
VGTVDLLGVILMELPHSSPIARAHVSSVSLVRTIIP